MANPQSTAPKTRKERRKEERLAKKHRTPQSVVAVTEATVVAPKVVAPKGVAPKGVAHPAKRQRTSTSDDPYEHLDPDVAAALRRDDDEIAALEAKLGVKDKKRLQREYAQQECYGDDFGDFLDDLDAWTYRVVNGDTKTEGSIRDVYDRLLDADDTEESDQFDVDDESEEEDEELVPMKEGAVEDLDDMSDDEDDQSLDNESIDDFNDAEDEEGDNFEEDEDNNLEEEGNDFEEDDKEHQEKVDDADNEVDELSDDNENDDEAPTEADHDATLTYRPTKGEDIYGKAIESVVPQVPPKKYVPPYLRASSLPTDDTERARQEGLRSLERSLNNALNRLSDDKLVPVVQSIVQLYGPHPAHDVNECYWKMTLSTCVSRDQIMTGIIPVFVAALVGVHLHKGDSAQLAEFIMERLVIDLVDGLKSARNDVPNGEDGDESDLTQNKKVCNLALLLCYFYNFGLVHCSLLYEIIRDLLDGCCEVDVEILLLVLSHCGRALRSDDPMAIKEIVLLVQQKALDKSIRSKISPSRCDYLVSAMTDLKNNKRRPQDQAHVDKTSKLRKSIGHLKSAIATSTKSQRCSDASLRISLSDILEAETKGRWWKVGASWAGNHRLGTEAKTTEMPKASNPLQQGANSDMDERLMALASKYRMNTDARRTVFCIIMGSIDYEDCFEKLVRAEMLKNRSERDAVRVLMECCGNEAAYNQFYSHLAARICEYQPQCKFTFQLAFWDTFKQFDDLKPRKVANLAKLLFHLVTVHNCLKINVIKAIDMSAIDELPETAMIFITIFLSSILEHFENPGDVARLFSSSVGHKKGKATDSDEDEAEVDMDHMDDAEALQANLTIFLVQVLKSSPKNKKGSTFRANLKAATKACNSNSFF